MKSKIFLLYLTLMATGCGKNLDKDTPFYIYDDYVSLQKSYIVHAKTKLYQPSFGLSGVVVPQRSSNISAPTHGKLVQILVQKGQFVHKGDALAVIYQPTTLPDPALLTQSLDDRRADNAHTTDDAQDNHTIHNKVDNAYNDAPNDAHSHHQATHDNNTDDGVNDSENSNDNHIDDSDHTYHTYGNANITSNALLLHTLSKKRLKPVWSLYNSDDAVVIKADIDGYVNTIYHKNGDILSQHDALFVLEDTRVLEFVAHIPTNFAHHLSIGQVVDFSVDAPKNSTATGMQKQNLTGQIVAININDDSTDVVVRIEDKNAVVRSRLTGFVNYNQLSIGVLVPKQAFAGAIGLSSLDTPPYQALLPLDGHIWTIEQDGRLYLTNVSVLQYLPESQQYLVVGINQASLIVKADLPKLADKMNVRLQ